MTAQRTLAHAILMTTLLGGAASARADVIIGDWENTPDGWIDWGTMATIDTTGAKYSYSSTFGVTHGSTALHVSQTAYNQNLSIKLQNNGLKDAFFQNQQFSIDFSVPGNSTAGYNQIYDIAINAQGYGFVSQGPVPKFTYGYPNGGPQTTTVTWDYSKLVDGDTTNGEIAPTAGWVEFILATNGDTSHPDFYFDNARLGKLPTVAGDFNKDNLANALDIDLLFHAAEGEVPFVDGTFDANKDGSVIVGPGVANSDSDYWVKTIKGTRYGDTNFDKQVNFDDLLQLAKHYNQQSGATWDVGSFNGDGIVNFDDLLTLAKNYGFNGTAPTATQLASLSPEVAADFALAQSLVPEPASIALLGLAMPLLRRRRTPGC